MAYSSGVPTRDNERGLLLAETHRMNARLSALLEFRRQRPHRGRRSRSRTPHGRESRSQAPDATKPRAVLTAPRDTAAERGDANSGETAAYLKLVDEMFQELMADTFHNMAQGSLRTRCCSL